MAKATRLGANAVVVGGSLAGLASARILADHFENVTLVERDSLDDAGDARSGVPQGRQFHVLLRGGADVYERLFPGFVDALVAGGAETVRWGRDTRWYHYGGWKQVHPASTFESVTSTRLLVEAIARRRLRAVDGVTILDGHVATGLVADREARRAVGVRVEPRGGGGAREIPADLVVDASGRDSKAPEWLAALGLPCPDEKMVNAHLGYATRVYRRRPGAPWKMLIIHATPPANSRIGAIMPIEGDRWHVVLCGANRDYPPTDEPGFLDFAQGLADPAIYDAIRDAEPLSSIHGYRRTENALRRYDRLPRRLDRLLLLGDAVCAFNPVYGQGMSTAALGAELLGRSLAAADRLDGLAGRFQRKLWWRLQVPWLLATAEDFRYPDTEGGKPGTSMRLLQGYVDRVIRRSAVDSAAYDAFVGVMHMVRSPAAILSPRVLLGSLLAAPPAVESPRAHPTLPSTTATRPSSVGRSAAR